MSRPGTIHLHLDTPNVEVRLARLLTALGDTYGPNWSVEIVEDSYVITLNS